MTTKTLEITGYMTESGVHLSDKYIVSVDTKTGKVYDILGQLHYFNKEEVCNYLERHSISNVNSNKLEEFLKTI